MTRTFFPLLVLLMIGAGPARAEWPTSGGDEGAVIHVDSLEDSGPGTLRAALLVDGSVKVGDETLGTWDFLRVPGGARGTVEFPSGATLLAVTLAQVTR